MKLIPIKTKKKYTYKGKVYDLSIENDHTYNIEGNIVHNSDYVMIGSLFNKTLQSAGFNYLWNIKLPYNLAKMFWKWGFPIKKKYRGMSTKAVQRKWGKAELTTAEGITKYQKIEYNLTQWVKNFEDYLKSNMSYCGTWDLEDFIGKVKWVYITNNALKRFQK